MLILMELANNIAAWSDRLRHACPLLLFSLLVRLF